MKAYRIQSAVTGIVTGGPWRRFVLAGVLLAGLCSACEQAQPVAGKTPPRAEDLRGVDAAERAAQPTGRAGTQERTTSPAAIVNGQTVSWEDLRPALTEAAGAQVLQETILDRALEEQVASKGIAISQPEIAAERAMLIQQITKGARTTPEDSERLLETVRRSRGLGEVRFSRLLERNARLRHLVGPAVQVSDEEVGLAFQMLHGPRYRVRVIVASSQQRAAALREQILLDKDHAPYPPDRVRSNFIAVAAAESVDPSAARGGQIDPISPLDDQYPGALRNAAATMTVGEVSPVLTVDKGFALALLEEILPADGVKLADVSDQIREEVRHRRERLEMDKLARRLVQTATVAIPDRSLDWSWRGREERK